MYTHRTTLRFAAGDTEHERELTFRYSVTPGSSDYWDGQQWQQGWAAEVNIETARVRIDGVGQDVPDWMLGAFHSDQELHGELLSAAADDDEYHRDQAADARREELRTESVR